RRSSEKHIDRRNLNRLSWPSYRRVGPKLFVIGNSTGNQRRPYRSRSYCVNPYTRAILEKQLRKASCKILDRSLRCCVGKQGWIGIVRIHGGGIDNRPTGRNVRLRMFDEIEH